MKDLIMYTEPNSSMAEEYRSIRANIEFLNKDKNLKTIVITSPNQGEGKSIVTANLGICFASINKKVLIIDCQLRNPYINTIFETNNESGVTDIILHNKSIDSCIKDTNIENLYVLSSGDLSPNPSEIITFNKMKEIISYARVKYDYILIDTPGLNLYTDAGVLSTYCDGVLMVIASAKTEGRIAKEAKDKLEKLNANILGVVLNKVPVDNGIFNLNKIKSKKK